MVGVTVLAGLAALIRATQPLLQGPDPFWHLDLGRRMVASGALPRTDPYSFLTSGQEWVLNQWGTELVIGLVDRVGGLQLLAIVTALVVGTAIGLTGRIMWRRSPTLGTLGLLGLVMLASMPGWVLRGSLASLALLPLLLSELRSDRPRPWVVALLMLLWANLHAAFLLGVGLVMVDSLGRVMVADPGSRTTHARHGGLVLLVSVLAPLANPYGLRYLEDVVTLAIRGPNTSISEWAPTTLTDLQVLPYTLLVTIVLTAVGVTARRRDLPEILLIVAATLFGITAQRNVGPSAIILGILGAPYVHRAWRVLTSRTESPEPKPVVWLDKALATSASLILLALVAFVVPPSSALQAHASGVPLTIIRELDQLDRPARVAAPSWWTPAISTLTGPRIRTEVDGRAELFTSEQLRRNLELHDAMPGWERTLDEWCVTDVVVPGDSPLHTQLAEKATWDVNSAGPLANRPTEHAVWLARSDALPGPCDAAGPS